MSVVSGIGLDLGISELSVLSVLLGMRGIKSSVMESLFAFSKKPLVAVEGPGSDDLGLRIYPSLVHLKIKK